MQVKGRPGASTWLLRMGISGRCFYVLFFRGRSDYLGHGIEAKQTLIGNPNCTHAARLFRTLPGDLFTDPYVSLSPYGCFTRPTLELRHTEEGWTRIEHPGPSLPKPSLLANGNGDGFYTTMPQAPMPQASREE